MSGWRKRWMRMDEGLRLYLVYVAVMVAGFGGVVLAFRVIPDAAAPVSGVVEVGSRFVLPDCDSEHLGYIHQTALHGGDVVAVFTCEHKAEGYRWTKLAEGLQ